MVWVETPTNPLLNIADIEALAAVAHDAGALLVVDNTFASPYLQQPLALGADVVVHSTTKYCGGHSDVVGGALVVRDLELAEQIAFHQNAIGAVAGPFDSWLVLRGLKTLGVRMDRHCDNAEKVVEFLTGHPAVSQVFYPGLEEHPGHEVASRQMKRYGGIVSFRVTGGEQHALDVCAKAEVFTLGESLGGVESLIEHPGRMTHASVAGTDLEVPDDLIRLSVGIETADDLLADLDRALAESRDEEPDDRAPDARFTLANERTLLAYQRSAIGLMAAAIAVAHFFGDDVDGAGPGARHARHRGVRRGGRLRCATGRSTPRCARAAPISSGSAAHLVSLAVLLCLLLAGVYVVTQAA